MLSIIKGNIFDGSENIICHQTNCLGIMGGGIAYQVKKQYPKVFLEYYELCNKIKNKKELLGQVQYCKISSDRYIANCFGQLDIGLGIQTNYNALKSCLQNVYETAQKYNYSVSIPYKIGCGLAGGDWNIVYKMIQDIFEKSKIDCVIYNFEG